MDEEIKVLPPSIGTILPICVDANVGQGLHMQDVNFECKFYTETYKKGIVVNKSEMFFVNEDEYIALVDSSKIGVGQYWLKFTAYVPDPRLDSGVRPEVVDIPLEGIFVVP